MQSISSAAIFQPNRHLFKKSRLGDGFLWRVGYGSASCLRLLSGELQADDPGSKLASFSSRIAKFAVMLDVAMLSPRFPFKGIIPPKKNECILTGIAAKVNRRSAANYAFEAVFQTVSSFFTIDRLAVIGEKMDILLG